ncbi:uncharacterized protein LOC127879745 isoform X2 [Dreissena polymorpha]|uniref:uncharacterized protein LOC127879745 isoform X2 n=1 Tax=Dreissena polymorpha TaxID=45954 RepID=UPI00226519A2|nr:uncharacterized protein LOC127879745 isoform X2 [Dreissena polymorpha]
MECRIIPVNPLHSPVKYQDIDRCPLMQNPNELWMQTYDDEYWSNLFWIFICANLLAITILLAAVCTFIGYYGALWKKKYIESIQTSNHVDSRASRTVDSHCVHENDSQRSCTIPTECASTGEDLLDPSQTSNTILERVLLCNAGPEHKPRDCVVKFETCKMVSESQLDFETECVPVAERVQNDWEIVRHASNNEEIPGRYDHVLSRDSEQIRCEQGTSKSSRSARDECAFASDYDGVITNTESAFLQNRLVLECLACDDIIETDWLSQAVEERPLALCRNVSGGAFMPKYEHDGLHQADSSLQTDDGYDSMAYSSYLDDSSLYNDAIETANQEERRAHHGKTATCCFENESSASNSLKDGCNSAILKDNTLYLPRTHSDEVSGRCADDTSLSDGPYSDENQGGNCADKLQSVIAYEDQNFIALVKKEDVLKADLPSMVRHILCRVINETQQEIIIGIWQRSEDRIVADVCERDACLLILKNGWPAFRSLKCFWCGDNTIPFSGGPAPMNEPVLLIEPHEDNVNIKTHECNINSSILNEYVDDGVETDCPVDNNCIQHVVCLENESSNSPTLIVTFSPPPTFYKTSAADQIYYDTTSTHSEGGNNDRFRQNDRKNDISFSGGMFTQIGDNNKLVLTIGGSSDAYAVDDTETDACPDMYPEQNFYIDVHSDTRDRNNEIRANNPDSGDQFIQVGDKNQILLRITLHDEGYSSMSSLESVNSDLSYRDLNQRHFIDPFDQRAETGGFTDIHCHSECNDQLRIPELVITSSSNQGYYTLESMESTGENHSGGLSTCSMDYDESLDKQELTVRDVCEQVAGFNKNEKTDVSTLHKETYLHNTELVHSNTPRSTGVCNPNSMLTNVGANCAVKTNLLHATQELDDIHLPKNNTMSCLCMRSSNCDSTLDTVDAIMDLEKMNAQSPKYKSIKSEIEAKTDAKIESNFTVKACVCKTNNCVEHIITENQIKSVILSNKGQTDFASNAECSRGHATQARLESATIPTKEFSCSESNSIDEYNPTYEEDSIIKITATTSNNLRAKTIVDLVSDCTNVTKERCVYNNSGAISFTGNNNIKVYPDDCLGLQVDTKGPIAVASIYNFSGIKRALSEHMRTSRLPFDLQRVPCLKVEARIDTHLHIPNKFILKTFQVGVDNSICVQGLRL